MEQRSPSPLIKKPSIVSAFPIKFRCWCVYLCAQRMTKWNERALGQRSGLADVRSFVSLVPLVSIDVNLSQTGHLVNMSVLCVVNRISGIEVQIFQTVTSRCHLEPPISELHRAALMPLGLHFFCVCVILFWSLMWKFSFPSGPAAGRDSGVNSLRLIIHCL